MSSQRRLLIANRGEIAVRILKTAKKLNFFAAVLYTSHDASSPHVIDADAAYLVSSYTCIPEIVSVIESNGIEYVIPGYGFLSENESFAAAVENAGAVFVGPTSDSIRDFGVKHIAREIASKAGVPIIQGTGLLEDCDVAIQQAEKIGYPVMLKATGGGGGMGLEVCHNSEQVERAYQKVTGRGKSLFSNSGVFMEKYIPVGHHVEVQIFGNGLGDCVDFGERECSIQRRHQKIIEESPSPFIEQHPSIRQNLLKTAVALGKSINYRSAGTIEYLVDDVSGEFYFLEMNTRLQVEHGITEQRFNIDLVELMLRQAETPLNLDPYRSIVPQGFSVEVRLYAENPANDYAPCPGVLQNVQFSEKVRIDTWVHTGTMVSVFYDPLLAKLISHGDTREAAIRSLATSMRESKVQGLITNLGFCTAILESERYARGDTPTSFLNDFSYVPQMIDVISPGAYTTIQDWPGRVGIGFGIPESGPMDSMSFRLANIIAGNPQGTEGLEITFSGPKLRFLSPGIVAVGGTDIQITVDDEPRSPWERIQIAAGSVLAIGATTGSGCRAYLAIRGGITNIASYLGSKATSPVVGMGGLQGRPLTAGDCLEISDITTYSPFSLPPDLVPEYDASVVYCMSGPHDSPDYITSKGLDSFYETEWTVSHQSNRTGVRLLGPKMDWARETGGAGGSHPSNIMDYGYSLGGVDWTGDDPVIFPADSPSLGGFITSHVVARAELIKVGQFGPGHKFSFRQISCDQGIELEERQNMFANAVQELASGNGSREIRPLDLNLEAVDDRKSSAILASMDDVTIRQAGSEYILIEYSQTLDLRVRYRVQAYCEALENAKISGIGIISPMPCSLLIQYNGRIIRQKELVLMLKDIYHSSSGSVDSVVLKSRLIRMPMVFDDAKNRACIDSYMVTQRPYASYLPDPIDFIARSNGLSCRDDVLDMALNVRLLVTGIGFYNGTPIALPLDPRKQLKVPKFNPSRNSSPAGGLGIGGSFWCLDPTDAPEFYQVTEPEFEKLYTQFLGGRYVFDIQECECDVGAYLGFCESVKDEVKVFRERQEEGTAREMKKEKELLEKWNAEKEADAVNIVNPMLDGDSSLQPIESPMHATVFKSLCKPGDILDERTITFILEVMKMETALQAPAGMKGMVVRQVCAMPGDVMRPGQTLALVGPVEA
ncbi:hypothetical protein FQN57_004622 [Myotisia sp. PD_48]|nr:hypothetical protein FQN57_004622 [Myotisia sp. PD_48]